MHSFLPVLPILAQHLGRPIGLQPAHLLVLPQRDGLALNCEAAARRQANQVCRSDMTRTSVRDTRTRDATRIAPSHYTAVETILSPASIPALLASLSFLPIALVSSGSLAALWKMNDSTPANSPMTSGGLRSMIGMSV
jgi:hypothetical protein